MSETGIFIFRLAIAAFNGVLFAAGIVWLLETVSWRPQRLRRRLRWLIASAEEDEIAGEHDHERALQAEEKREEIDRLKRQLKEYLQRPRTLLHLAFAIMMIVVALFALINLISPIFSPFI